MTNAVYLPPIQHNDDGALRKVGLELEFSGLTIAQIADIIVHHFDGEIRRISDYEIVISDASVGNFRVELDFEYLKQKGREPIADNDGLLDALKQLPEAALAELASHVVPIEIISPPIAPSCFPAIDALVEHIRADGAKGTRHSPLYAFGLHLNPEVPSLHPKTIVRHLQAFVCLYDWLVEKEDVDWSRHLTPYIQPYPFEYVQTLLNPAYYPNEGHLIDDYLRHNAERNRALDMLPLFAYMDGTRVKARIDDNRIKPRPTFHYRLPNCDIDMTDWTVTNRWRNWLSVEHLAMDDLSLTQACQAYRELHAAQSRTASREWVTACKRWIK